MTVEYWVMLPSNFKADENILAFRNSWWSISNVGTRRGSMWHEYQYFCSKGYGVVTAIKEVLEVGLDFLRGNINDGERTFKVMF
jgi:hypothetical protein